MLGHILMLVTIIPEEESLMRDCTYKMLVINDRLDYLSLYMHYVERPRRKTQRVDLEKFCPGSPFEPSFSPSSWPAPLQHDAVSPARCLTCGPVA